MCSSGKRSSPCGKEVESVLPELKVKGSPEWAGGQVEVRTLQVNRILPPTPPPTSSLKQGRPRLLGCGAIVPLWDFYFPRFKTVHGTHTKTCVLFASSDVKTVSRMCQGQVRFVRFSLSGFLN